MLKVDVKIKYLCNIDKERATMPKYATDGSAGCDLYANLDKPYTLKKGERFLVPTGIAIELPSPSFVALIFARSGLASKFGITMANGVGVIDSDYVGEIKCAIANAGSDDFVIRSGDRIAQMLIMPVYMANFIEVAELSDTNRGAGGFGSTGI